MARFLYKDHFKKLITHFTFKDSSLSNVNDVNNNDIPMRDIDNNIDDRVRVNFTVCDM